MALVGGRWFVEYTLVDTGAQSSSKRFEMNAPADYAAAVVFESTFRLDLLGVTDLSIKSYRIYQEFYEDAFALPADAQIEDQAVLVFELPNPLKSATVIIPGAKETLYVAASGANNNVIDTADAAVIAFATNFLSGGVNEYLLSDGEEAAALLRGHRRHVKKAVG